MKINKIILSGCSFTHGFDLCYEKFGIAHRTAWPDAEQRFTPEQWEYFDNVSLAGRLRSRYNCDMVNLSRPGYSNTFISNQIIKHIEQNKDNIDPATTLVVVGWTENVRVPFYSKSGCVNTALSKCSNYVKVTKEQKPFDEAAAFRLKIYEGLQPIEKLFSEDHYFAMTFYEQHINSILLLQNYLDRHGIKSVYFNSLDHWPFYPGYNFSDYVDLSDMVHWSHYYPHGNKESYWKNWWGEILRKGTYNASSHPNEKGVLDFSKKLGDFIDNVIGT